MKKLKINKTKVTAWFTLILFGGAFIVWADAICDFFKLEFGANTLRVFFISSIILIIGLFFGVKKIIKLVRGQLGA